MKKPRVVKRLVVGWIVIGINSPVSAQSIIDARILAWSLNDQRYLMR